MTPYNQFLIPSTSHFYVIPNNPTPRNKTQNLKIKRHPFNTTPHTSTPPPPPPPHTHINSFPTYNIQQIPPPKTQQYIPKQNVSHKKNQQQQNVIVPGVPWSYLPHILAEWDKGGRRTTKSRHPSHTSLTKVSSSEGEDEAASGSSTTPIISSHLFISSAVDPPSFVLCLFLIFYYVSSSSWKVLL